jgi:uncharacterized small protein (DUF1192 family)
MEDENAARRPKAHEVGMPLDTMGVAELEDRITLLRDEIARIEVALALRQKTRNAAESLFKF